jgi:hypothetical protein
MMLIRRARFDPAKSCNAKTCALGREPKAIVSDLVLECEFGPGKQTAGASFAAKPRVDVP